MQTHMETHKDRHHIPPEIRAPLFGAVTLAANPLLRRGKNKQHNQGQAPNEGKLTKGNTRTSKATHPSSGNPTGSAASHIRGTRGALSCPKRGHGLALAGAEGAAADGLGGRQEHQHPGVRAGDATQVAFFFFLPTTLPMVKGPSSEVFQGDWPLLGLGGPVVRPLTALNGLRMVSSVVWAAWVCAGIFGRRRRATRSPCSTPSRGQGLGVWASPRPTRWGAVCRRPKRAVDGIKLPPPRGSTRSHQKNGHRAQFG